MASPSVMPDFPWSSSMSSSITVQLNCWSSVINLKSVSLPLLKSSISSTCSISQPLMAKWTTKILNPNSNLGPYSSPKTLSHCKMQARLCGTLTTSLFFSALMTDILWDMTTRGNSSHESCSMKEQRSTVSLSARTSVFWVLQLIMDQRSSIHKLWKSSVTLSNNCQWTPSPLVPCSVQNKIQSITWSWVAVSRLSWLLWQEDRLGLKLMYATLCMAVKLERSVDILGRSTLWSFSRTEEATCPVLRRELSEWWGLTMPTLRREMLNFSDAW